jgi:hypothetical protein
MSGEMPAVHVTAATLSPPPSVSLVKVTVALCASPGFAVAGGLHVTPVSFDAGIESAVA